MKKSGVILSILFLSLVLSVSLVSAGFFEDFLNLFKPTPNFSPPTSGLIASYSLNGNANDNSGNNRHGTIFGAPAVIEGKDGTAYSLDGVDDKIVFQDTDTDYVTVAGWFYFDSNTPSTTRAITKWSGPSNNDLSWKLGTGLDTYYNFFMSTSSGNLLEARTPTYKHSRWVHLVGTFDGTTAKIYVNGILEDEVLVSGSPKVLNKNAGRIIIGTTEENNQFMKGSVDEVYIYNRALTQSEVKQLYENTKPRFVNFPTSFTPTAAFYREWNAKGTQIISTSGSMISSFDGLLYSSSAAPAGSGPTQGVDPSFLTTVAYNIPGQVNNVTRLFGRINSNPATYYRGAQGNNYTYVTSYPFTGVAVEGYYDLFNKGHQVIFTQDNKVYTFSTETSGPWISTALSTDSSARGYPNQLPKAAYFYRFTNCVSPWPIGDTNNDRIITIEDVPSTSELNQKGGCEDVDGDGTVTTTDQNIILDIFQGINGFQNRNVDAANAGIHYWFDINGQAKLYEYKGRGNFVDTPIPSGLPRFIGPDFGYYDYMTNNIVLWYGANAYASTDGDTFSLVYGAGVPGCDVNDPNFQCPSGQVCTANNQCVPIQCTVNNDCIQPAICSGGLCNSVQCTSTNLANCGSTSSQLVCGNSTRIDNRTITPSCLGNNTCSTTTTNSFVQNCQNGCLNGACLSQCTATNLNNCQPASSILLCGGNNNREIINQTRTPLCTSGVCGVNEVSFNTNVTCPYGCQSGACQPQCSSSSQCNANNGEICSNGLCVQDTCSLSDPCPSGFFCSSQNICLQGSVCIDFDLNNNATSTLSNVSYGNGTLGYVDSCQNATNLLEGVCNPNTNAAEQQTIVCPGGCLNGACQGVQPIKTCVDSDSGKNYTVKGTVNLTTGGSSILAKDVCTNSNYVKEYYCENNELASESKFCDLGCDDAKCKVDTSDPDDQVTCISGEEKCGIGNNYYYTCINRAWSQANLVDGKCGYTIDEEERPPVTLDCTDDFDCNDDEICNSDNECEVLELNEDSLGSTWKIVIGVLSGMIFIVAGIIIYLKIKRINSKQNHSVTMVGRRPGYPPAGGMMVRPGFPPPHRPGPPGTPPHHTAPGNLSNNPNLRKI